MGCVSPWAVGLSGHSGQVERRPDQGFVRTLHRYGDADLLRGRLHHARLHSKGPQGADQSSELLTVTFGACAASCITCQGFTRERVSGGELLFE